ncbi:hypothetical protein DEU56DRAFT_805026 [Suillus clintonianus]|uniref:uncharacterized protein n=1 Tax=Suillus clintonianus TaxID=1904413 RepID=UPI001B86DF59|nr:uncharacterized protein DEU56DRAFT_805026 [Suillus clintonianus]KAG2136639.1 hypothetical protein DEU56DRAFT_805026 [Suillus clintonianus]
MINHPYGASSSYMYANVDDGHSQSYYVSPPPERLYSFVPRMSVDSMPWYGATDYSGTTSNRDYYDDQPDSLPIRWTLRERTWRLLKGVGAKVSNRWRPLHLRSLFLRPCHYDVRDDPDIYL